MVPESRIKAELKRTLNETSFEGLGERHQGKVRESYIQGDRRILITTDRVSAFDCIYRPLRRRFTWPRWANRSIGSSTSCSVWFRAPRRGLPSSRSACRTPRGPTGPSC